MDCIWVNLKNVGPPFFKFISVYIKMSFRQLENHSQLLCGRDSENSDLQIGERGRLRVRVLSSEHFENFRPPNLKRVLTTCVAFALECDIHI